MTDISKLTVNTGDLPAGIFSAGDIGPKSFSFRPQNSPEILRLDEEGMVFRGARITDAGEAYAAWMKAMSMMQGKTVEDDDEPVAWLGEDMDHGCLYYLKQDAIEDGCVFIFPVYRRPQPKALLTDEEILDAANQADFRSMVTVDDYIYVIARAIEDKIWGRAE